MAKSHKDRGYDLPRVPSWARAKPEQVIEDKRIKKERKQSRKQRERDEYNEYY